MLSTSCSSSMTYVLMYQYVLYSHLYNWASTGGYGWENYLSPITPETDSAIPSRVSVSPLNLHTPRLNLVYDHIQCGRVFPAGVGPGSPSRDAANWLPSRFSLSVETRRRYGWLRMMVFPGARLFPSPNLVPFGRVAARERQGALSRRAW